MKFGWFLRVVLAWPGCVDCFQLSRHRDLLGDFTFQLMPWLDPALLQIAAKQTFLWLYWSCILWVSFLYLASWACWSMPTSALRCPFACQPPAFSWVLWALQPVSQAILALTFLSQPTPFQKTVSECACKFELGPSPSTGTIVPIPWSWIRAPRWG